MSAINEAELKQGKKTEILMHQVRKRAKRKKRKGKQAKVKAKVAFKSALNKGRIGEIPYQKCRRVGVHNRKICTGEKADSIR